MKRHSGDSADSTLVGSLTPTAKDSRSPEADIVRNGTADWTLKFLPEAKKDMANLAGNQRILVTKAIEKVRQNPVSVTEGGYGKPLGNKGGRNLTGMMKIKLKDAGLRVVYKLIRTETEMIIVVVGARADEEVYEIAGKRAVKHNL